ncbi:hypothetical protein KAI32_02970 [Candidatus Pacearchaeota archaeon]|nr:hypothetical protein [Candidatus Pacearchaeota archaeon]
MTSHPAYREKNEEIMYAIGILEGTEQSIHEPFINYCIYKGDVEIGVERKLFTRERADKTYQVIENIYGKEYLEDMEHIFSS